jgi:hypothetical protein
MVSPRHHIDKTLASLVVTFIDPMLPGSKGANAQPAVIAREPGLGIHRRPHCVEGVHGPGNGMLATWYASPGSSPSAFKTEEKARQDRMQRPLATVARGLHVGQLKGALASLSCPLPRLLPGDTWWCRCQACN